MFCVCCAHPVERDVFEDAGGDPDGAHTPQSELQTRLVSEELQGRLDRVVRDVVRLQQNKPLSGILSQQT